MWVPKIQPVSLLWSHHHRRQHCPKAAYQHNLDGDLRCPTLVLSPNDSNSLFLVLISCLLGISLGPYPCFTVLVPAPTKRFFGARGAHAKSVCLDAKMAAGFIVETRFAKANSTSAGVTSTDFKIFFFLTLHGITLLQTALWGPRRGIFHQGLRQQAIIQQTVLT